MQGYETDISHFAPENTDSVQGWKATLRKGKRKVHAKQIEEASNDGLSLDDVNQLVECSQMWEEFDDICRQCRRGGDGISDYEQHLCSIVVATTILYKSWQWPVAIYNATLDKLKAAKMVVKDGKNGHYYQCCCFCSPGPSPHEFSTTSE